MHGKLDAEGAAALLRVSRELVRGTPGNFAEVHCDLRPVAGEPGAASLRVTCPQFPEAGEWPPTDALRAAALDLLRALERCGANPAGVRVVSAVAPDKKVTTSFVPLARPGSARDNSEDPP
jgi:hypothetical protein